MKESDFLLIGSKREHRFDYPALKQIYDKNPSLRSDLEYLGLSDIYAVQGFYRMGREGFLAFSKGADINTDDGAQLEFSAPKNLRRPTTVLNQRIMAPYLIDSPPWLKTNSLPIPEAMHHYYMAESYVASVSQERALRELEQAIQLDPKNPKFYLLQTKIYLDQDKSVEAAKSAFKALELDPFRLQVPAMSDEFYLPDAKAVYAKVIESDSREILPYLGLGNIALHSGDLKEAEKWFEQARAMQPEHPAVLLAWGRFRSAQAGREKDPNVAKKQWQEAKDFLEKSKATELEKWRRSIQKWVRSIRSWACGRRPPIPIKKRCGCAAAETSGV
jgi:tetratricopeptide (TPR) repeat protein